MLLKSKEKTNEKDTGELTSDTRALSEEIASGKPRKKYLNLSLDGIAKAAKKVGRVADPILKMLTSIAAFVAKP